MAISVILVNKFNTSDEREKGVKEDREIDRALKESKLGEQIVRERERGES